jgi:hypothetical protein
MEVVALLGLFGLLALVVHAHTWIDGAPAEKANSRAVGALSAPPDRALTRFDLRFREAELALP